MGLMASGTAFLNRSVKATHGVTVVYSRGAVSATLTAVVGRTVFSRNTPNGAAVEIGERDYLINVADLVLSGSAVEPVKGDRITEVINGISLVFEIVPPLGEPAWRYSDPSRTKYRLHMKKVA